MTVKNRIESLRRQMRDHQFDAFIISGSDPHQSENTPDRWRIRQWLTGFTGSAGTVVVTHDKAGLWTDFRYYIQAEKQLESSGIELFHADEVGVQTPAEWLSGELKAGSRAAVEGKEISAELFRQLARDLSNWGIDLESSEGLIDEIWLKRPDIPDSPVREVPEAICGMSREKKLERIRQELFQRHRADYLLLSSLDDIAWTLNLRGADIPYSPVFTAFLLIGLHSAVLFCRKEKIPEALERKLAETVEIASYDTFFSEISAYILPQSKVVLSPEKTSTALYQRIADHTGITEAVNLTTYLKARKNPVELEGMRRVHRYDGAAMVSFLHWFETRTDGLELSEMRIAEVLRSFRSRQEGFIDESFSPIAAFAENGALCHYSANKDQNASVAGSGLLVLDSGGQYLGGTTDITRTLLAGEPTQQQREEYTLVLKGHLALVRQQFPEGTRGYQLDVLARKPLWDLGIDYGHGTGHGVGFMLNVHEGPQSISKRPVDVVLKPGMIVSNEPGVYREGRFGIRIENLLAVRNTEKTEFGQFMGFEDLTRCPYERRLIEPGLLTEDEKNQINHYHALVYTELENLLNEEECIWLKQKTLPL
jgi:Xaa-Pro aminopeptidase